MFTESQKNFAKNVYELAVDEYNKLTKDQLIQLVATSVVSHRTRGIGPKSAQDLVTIVTGIQPVEGNWLFLY